MLIFVGLAACTPQDSSQQIIIPGSNEISINFSASLLTVEEGKSIDVTLKFGKTTTKDGYIDVSYSSDNAKVGEDFNLSPTPVSNMITIDYQKDVDEVSFSILTLSDSDTDEESILFSISGASENISFDKSNDLSVVIEDHSSVSSDQQLNVVTWNTEYFPKNGTTTVNAVRDIVLSMDADIIAFQEIAEPDAFEDLATSLPGWEGVVYDVRYGQELGYLYKTSEITSFSSLSVIYNDDSDAFPRQPVIATAKHKSGLEVTLINIHLKCCSEGESRRADASVLLKDYIDQNLADKNVIVLGDYNDDILNGSPFSNFIADASNYEFTDMDIAKGSSAYWSYPGWPSHLDHIMISNELFDNWVRTETLRFDLTVNNYDANVSDHRPVETTFENQ